LPTVDGEADASADYWKAWFAHPSTKICARLSSAAALSAGGSKIDLPCRGPGALPPLLLLMMLTLMPMLPLEPALQPSAPSRLPCCGTPEIIPILPLPLLLLLLLLPCVQTTCPRPPLATTLQRL
jgi:hypothetical protein